MTTPEVRADEQPSGESDHTVSVPIANEQLVVDKHRVEGQNVKVSSHTESRDEWVEDSLERQNISIERVTVNRYVDEVPTVRESDGLTVVPVFEEVLVVEKRLLLREEIHIRKSTSYEEVREKISLRKTHVSVDANDTDGQE